MNKPLTVKVQCQCGLDVEVQPARLMAQHRFKDKKVALKQIQVMNKGFKKKYKI